MRNIGLVDYGTGNLRSVVKAFEHLGAQVTLIQESSALQDVDAVVFPGQGTFDQCMQHKQLVMAWSPLAGGKLATSQDVPAALVEVLQSLAEREGVDQATISLAFVLAHPATPVALVGSIDRDRIAQAKQALDVTLERKDVYQIIEASMGESLP